jgi:hypothetical protein
MQDWIGIAVTQGHLKIEAHLQVSTGVEYLIWVSIFFWELDLQISFEGLNLLVPPEMLLPFLLQAIITRFKMKIKLHFEN